MRDRGTCNNILTMRGEDVEEAILRGLRSRLMQSELFEEFAREFMAETNRQNIADGAALLAARKELDRINRQIVRMPTVMPSGAGYTRVR